MAATSALPSAPACRRRSARCSKARSCCRSTSRTARRPPASPATASCCPRLPGAASRSSPSTWTSPTSSSSASATARWRSFSPATSSCASSTATTSRASATQLGEPVWEGELAIANELNKEVTTSFPVDEALPNRKPGVYVLTAQPKDDRTDSWISRATQWFVVSDIGLSTYTGQDGLNVFARSLGSAQDASPMST